MKAQYKVVERHGDGVIYSGDDPNVASKLAIRHNDHCTLYSASPHEFKTSDRQTGENLTLSVRRYWGGGQWDPVKMDRVSKQDKRNLISLIEELPEQENL